MKRTYFLTLALMLCGSLCAQVEVVTLHDGTEVKVDRKIFPDLDLNQLPQTPPAEYIARRKARAEGREAQIQLPPAVNNGEDKYFPPIFNQDGGSCGSAQNIGYMFTHEINAWRDLDASLPENQYPTHFTWLLTYSNSGKEEMAMANGIPTVATYGGRTYSRLFGAQTCDDSDFGWMQGYDKWYSAMWNRAAGSFGLSATNTPEGRRELKEWLYNHSGDETMHSGGIVGIGLAAYGTWAAIPTTEANKAAGVSGKKYVKTWGDTYNHAVTICGYDDRIEFDLDEDGVIGEADEDEVGAWIIANSWGDGWENKGFIYCPYKYSYSVGTSTMPWTPGSYYIRRDYRPLRTIKLLMEYSHRSEMMLCAGVSANIDATKPDKVVNFEHFKYAGNGAQISPDPAMPMLGRWADGIHYEPMEFGYDLTDLTSGFDRTRPLKYFFMVKTKETAQGQGHILAASIMNYETDIHGVEIPFDQQNVEIQNAGSTTIISCVVPGEQIYPPSNLQMADGVLWWEAPSPSGLKLLGYNLYDGQTCVATIQADKTCYTPSQSMSTCLVKAVYQVGEYKLESAPTNSVSIQVPVFGDNEILNMSQSGFTIPSVISEDLAQATIEFWMKCTTNTNYLQQVGPGWGRFLFHTDASGKLYAGWNTSSGDRMQVASIFRTNIWTHVAIVIDGNQMTAYVNGLQKGKITSNNYSGLTAFGNLPFGRGGSDSWWNGCVDDVRVWKTARSQADIRANMRTLIARPADYPDLIAYLPMDRIEVNGETLLRDWAGGHHASIQKCGTSTVETSEAPFASSSSSPKLSIVVQEGVHTCGMPLQVKANCSLSATEWTWNAPGSLQKECHGVAPMLCYEEAGSFPISCSVIFSSGDTLTAETTVDIQEGVAPVADILIPDAELPAGERFCLVNRTVGEGCSYLWSMPGAEVEQSTATNTTVLYPQTGTFEITLTATNRYGSSTATRTVVVQEAAPMPIFDVSHPSIIKGDTIELRDHSRYSPTSWKWQLSNGHRALLVDQSSPMVVPTAPGIYDVSLTVGNALGSNTSTRKKILIVGNADAGSSLNFNGTERLSLTCPFETELSALTLDWWMRPQTYEGSVCFSSASAQLSTSVSIRGALSITLGEKTATSLEEYIIPGEWHHYAITFSNGMVKFYRDALLVNTSATRLATRMPALGEIVVGAETGGFKGQMDEVRLWNAALSIDAIARYANLPIYDVPTTEAEEKLLLYYDFNQNGGDVKDRCSGAHDARRIGFGPDGDAWGSAEGVFTLDLDSPTSGDCSAKYLTNYKNPFISSVGTINANNNTRFVKLAMGTIRSRWKDANSVVSGGITTGAHIDRDHHGDIQFETTWSGFASELKDYRLWQPVTLPAGKYTFGVTFGDGTDYTDSRLVVCAGSTMVSDASCAEEALAWVPLGTGSVEFELEEEQQVSLGIIVNMSGKLSFGINAFYLEGLATEWLAPIDPTAISSPAGTEWRAPWSSQRYDLNGIPVTDSHRGVSVIKGKKVLTK